MSVTDVKLEWTKDILTVILRSPFLWWSVIISLFYLIEKLDLGVHCFSWLDRLRRRRRHHHDNNAAVCNGKQTLHTVNGIHSGSNHSECEESKIGNGCTGNGRIRNGHSYSGHVIQNGHVPTVLNDFIRRAVIPTFKPHTEGKEPHFSVLVLSNISSVGEVKHVNFRQVTFNGRPFVDPKLTVYPQSYRYENYIVARPSGDKHAEALIIKDLQTLLKAYGVKERCYLRSPAPKFGLMYCWTMPCSDCTQLLVNRLSSVCSQKFVLVYSHENSEKWSKVQESRRTLKAAGILVAKIAPE